MGGGRGGEGVGGYHAAFLWPQLFRPLASIDYSKPQSGLPHVPGNTTHLENGWEILLDERNMVLLDL